MASELPDRICIWDADNGDPNSARGWTVSFSENHPNIYVRAATLLRPAPSATPADATDEMVEAALAVDWDNEDERATVHNIWHAMTAKLPSSPAPAATDTGLETYEHDNGTLSGLSRNEKGPWCLRSQAEELLAAERAEKEQLEAAWLEAEGIISDLKADNAAQAARIKELERHSCDNGFCHTDHWYDKAKALETQLAAAEKALEPFARLEIPSKPQGNAGAYSIRHKDILEARTALGGKPS